MNKHMIKAMSMDNSKWVEGYYFAEPFTAMEIYGDKEYKIEYECVLLPERQEVQIMGNTICRYVRDAKHSALWENDIFWVCSAEGILGCIEWGDDYDGWVVNEYPNVVEGECVPDFDNCLETHRLEEYDGSYEFIYENMIGKNKIDFLINQK